MEHYRNAVEMVTAPGAFLELTTIEVGGHELKAYQHAPGSMRDLWFLGQGYGDQEYIVYGDERWTFAEAGQSSRISRRGCKARASAPAIVSR